MPDPSPSSDPVPGPGPEAGPENGPAAAAEPAAESAARAAAAEPTAESAAPAAVVEPAGPAAEPASEPVFDPSAETVRDPATPRFDPASETVRDPASYGPDHIGAEGNGPLCPVCGTVAPPDARFCEIDGTPLGVCACVNDGDGFCEKCGMKMIPELARGPELGAATHVGASHDTNQDAVGLDRRGRIDAIVVCDGVSSSSHGELAAQHAAEAGLAALLAAAEGPAPLDPEGALREAVRAAHRAACEAIIESEEGKDRSGTTFVAALVNRTDGIRIDVGWVGDSRAYLVGPNGPVALTHDHSFVNQMVDSGSMTEAEAMRSPYAHAITHCMGPLEDPDPEKAPEPSLGHVVAEPGGRLVVCSDGLWNYFPTPSDIAGLLTPVPPGTPAGGVASALVNRALAMGGHDDVTVAIAFLD